MLPLTAGSPAAATHALLDAVQRPGPCYRRRIDPESSAAYLIVCRFRICALFLAKCHRSPLDPLQLLLTLSWMLPATAGESIGSLQQLT
ncbi:MULTISPECIES: hypothetical protein [unclassified Paenibacillus]|uniref:hypothetical protein n=1 Tax=unclassified Paenibacillus TaxID=185978 RepID=UPI0030FCCB71